MRIFVAGATGVLGHRIVEECADRGHTVVGLTRDDRGDALVRESGGEPLQGDLFDQDSLIDGAEGADAVVHAATKIPTDPKPSDEDWAQNDRVRREGTGNLVAAAAEVRVDRFLQQSIVWVARQPDGSPFDESSPPHPDRSTRSALDAERIVLSGAREHGFDAVVLRGGYFYAADTAHTRTFGEQLLARKLPIIGGGVLGRRDATLSFLHVDDAARAYAEAVEGNAAGTFHVIDDEPVTYAAFLQTFAEHLGAPRPRRVPAWLARLFVDTNLVRLLTHSMPTSNERFCETFDWEPAYPSVREGIEQVVGRWKEAGAVREAKGGYAWVGV